MHFDFINRPLIEAYKAKRTDDVRPRKINRQINLELLCLSAMWKWAYEDGNLIRPDDNPVVPLPPGESTPVPTPTPQVTVTRVSNWQIWMALFVDEGVLEAVASP